MSDSGCVFSDYVILLAVSGGAALFGLILLCICGGKRLSFSEYLSGTWNFAAFAVHVILASFLLYTPRVLPKSPNETAPKSDDYLACFANAVRKTFREYGEVDNRIFLDEFQPEIKTTMYGYAVVASIPTLLTFLGHLRGAKWTHGMQIVSATWHIALVYGSFMPQYLVGYKQIKDLTMFAVYNLPFVVFPILAILSSLCKLCCDKQGNSVCPVVSSTGPSVQKKKKQ